MTDFLQAPALRSSVLGGLWAEVEIVASTGSTNADLAAWARRGGRPGKVLVTADQQAGRGRLTRSWVTPPDTAVACSVLVAPRRPVQEWGWLPLLVGMAVSDGVHEATGLDARVKWPNDVMVGERKLCGILCEAVGDAGTPLAVLGFGLNVGLTPDQLPVPTATSVHGEGSDASATAVTVANLRALERWFTRWDDGADLIADYRERCGTLGRDVTVHRVGAQDVTGRAVDVDADGGIVVATPGGRRTFVAGDVEHLRRA